MAKLYNIYYGFQVNNIIITAVCANFTSGEIGT